MHGKGLLKTEEYFYDGEFNMNIKQGFGFLHNIKYNYNYEGQFSNDLY